MLPIRWRLKAEADLAEILDYIAQRNPQAALDLQNQMHRAISQLPVQRRLYRPGRVQGMPELVVRRNYIVVYRVHSQAVEIVSVLHARRRYPRA